MKRILLVPLLLCLLTACAGGGSYAQRSPAYVDGHAYSRCQHCGTVERIDLAAYGDGRSSGAGAVAGALIGGVLGSQVGSGNGRRAATVAGAIAGGVAGNQIESRRNQRDIHAVFVRMDDGRRVVLEQRAIDGLYEGARVQVRNGRARRL